MRNRIRYCGDVWNIETLQTPETTVELGQGDCDDKAALVAALLMSIGYPVQFAVLERDGEFVHVWCQVRLRGQWYDLETTEPILAGQCPRLADGDQVHTYPVSLC